MRILTKRTKLYTEMVVDNTVLHTDSLDWHLRFTEEERPVALQMGGSDPEMLEEAVQKILAAGYAYDEIDLNCGCPSDRVATVSGATYDLPWLSFQAPFCMCRKAVLGRD